MKFEPKRDDDKHLQWICTSVRSPRTATLTNSSAKLFTDVISLVNQKMTLGILTLKIFLAECARLRIMPGQTDFIQAYLQVPVRDRIFVIFPSYWSKWLPPDLQKYCGVPMQLLKSLYGYCMSGKLFWEEQAIVLKNFGMTPCDAAPAFWYKHYPTNDVLLVLQYSDDLM